MKKAYVDISGGQMHYRYSGSGIPVIMIHMSGSSSDEYEAVGNILADRFAVYAIDLFAFGMSEKPEHMLTLAEHAKSVVEFMDAVGISATYLVGNLVGANIAMLVADLEPDKVLGMLLSSYRYKPDHAAYCRQLRQSPVYQPVQIAPDGRHLIENWNRTARYKVSPEIIHARSMCMCMAGEFSESLHWAQSQSEDPATMLKSIRTAVMLLSSEDESELAITRLLLNMLPNAVQLTVNGLFPLYIRSRPEAFAAVFSEDFMEFISKSEKRYCIEETEQATDPVI